MRWPWNRRPELKRAVERKAVLGTTKSLGSFLAFDPGGASTPSQALALYEESTTVSVPINMVADAFSVLVPVLQVGDKVVREHPVLDLLRRPSPWHDRLLFLEVLSKNYLVTGELHVVALGAVAQPPKELHPVSPKSMTPVRASEGDWAARWLCSGTTLPGAYESTPVRAGREVRYYDGPLRELWTTRNFSTRDNSLLRGQSLLVSAAREARQSILGAAHNVSLLEKGGRVSLVFHFNEDMNEDDFEEVKERVRLQYGGASQAGEIGVTAGGKLDIKEVGVNNKDMDFARLEMMAKKALALQYHVPLPLVSDERMTFNNYAEAKLALYDDAVIPLAGKVLGSLSDFLLPRYGMDPAKARLTFDQEQVTALVTRRNKELLDRKAVGVESHNELRSLLGREPYEGGDVVLVPANMVPAGTDLFTRDNEPDRIEPSGGASRPGKVPEEPTESEAVEDADEGSEE